MINPNLYLMIMDRLKIPVVQGFKYNESDRGWAL
jgi:hypothetical protein